MKFKLLTEYLKSQNSLMLEISLTLWYMIYSINSEYVRCWSSWAARLLVLQWWGILWTQMTTTAGTGTERVPRWAANFETRCVKFHIRLVKPSTSVINNYTCAKFGQKSAIFLGRKVQFEPRPCTPTPSHLIRLPGCGRAESTLGCFCSAHCLCVLGRDWSWLLI